MSVLRAIAAVVPVVLLVGCTPTAPPTSTPSLVPTSTSPSPEPSPTCSPYNGTPKPCTPEEASKTEEQNALISQAEQTYRKYFEESDRVQRMGGATKPTEQLLETLTGKALKSAMEVYKDLKVNKTRAQGGSFAIVSITPKPTRTKDGSVMSLDVCWRAKDVKFKVDGVTLTRNAIVREDSYLRKDGGNLKIALFEYEEVSKC